MVDHVEMSTELHEPEIGPLRVRHFMRRLGFSDGIALHEIHMWHTHAELGTWVTHTLTTTTTVACDLVRHPTWRYNDPAGLARIRQAEGELLARGYTELHLGANAGEQPLPPVVDAKTLRATYRKPQVPTADELFGTPEQPPLTSIQE